MLLHSIVWYKYQSHDQIDFSINNCTLVSSKSQHCPPAKRTQPPIVNQDKFFLKIMVNYLNIYTAIQFIILPSHFVSHRSRTSTLGAEPFKLASDTSPKPSPNFLPRPALNFTMKNFLPSAGRSWFWSSECCSCCEIETNLTHGWIFPSLRKAIFYCITIFMRMWNF